MSRALAIIVLTILPYYYVSAVNIPACLPGYTWSYNSLGQTPCDMATTLGGVCVGPQFELQQLPPNSDYEYLGPTPTTANTCRCSSVYYSLLSACGVCQNDTYLPWSTYTTNCTNVYLQVFKDPIPPTTRIPQYAYLDVNATDGFNVALAQNAFGPESTAISQSGTESLIPTATATSVATSSKSNIGPIVGGVVGGAVFLALFAVLIFLILRRRKQSIPNDSTYNSVASPAMMNYGNVKYDSWIPTSVAPVKVYDPNDPSTFPTNNTVASPDFSQQRPLVTPTFTGTTATSTPGAGAGAGRPNYTGVPEL